MSEKKNYSDLHPILAAFEEFADEYENTPPDDDTLDMLMRRSGVANLNEETAQALDEFFLRHAEAVLNGIRNGMPPTRVLTDCAAICTAFGIMIAKKGLI